jgi:hypothetical protein
MLRHDEIHFRATGNQRLTLCSEVQISMNIYGMNPCLGISAGGDGVEWNTEIVTCQIFPTCVNES